MSTRKRKYGSVAADNAARKIVRRAKATALKMGRPASRGFRGTYGKYKRTSKEKKIIDFNVTTSFVNDAATAAGAGLRLINGVDQGSDYNQRIGRQIKMTSIFFRATAQLAASPNAVSSIIRLMIVYDSQANNVNATGTDILQTDTSPESVNNLSNRDRFKVLYDKVRHLCAQGVTNGALGDRCYFTKYIKCGLPVVFSGTNNLIGSIQTGAVYVLCSGSLATGNASVPSIEFNSRVRFIDD